MNSAPGRAVLKMPAIESFNIQEKARREEVSKLTGLYAPAETVRHSRRGQHTLPRPADLTRVAPHPAEMPPRAVAAPSPAFLVSKSTAVDPVTTWVLHPGRDRHIGSLPGLCGPRRGRAATAASSMPIVVLLKY